MLCCGYTLTDFPISIRLTSLALWQSNDCPSASKATLMHMDKYFMWIHYERLHNHSKAKHNETVCIFLGIYCTSLIVLTTNCEYQQYHHLVIADFSAIDWLLLFLSAARNVLKWMLSLWYDLVSVKMTSVQNVLQTWDSFEPDHTPYFAHRSKYCGIHYVLEPITMW